MAVGGVLAERQTAHNPDAKARDGAGVGGSVSSVNVTFFSIHDFQPRPLARPGQTLLADWNNTTTAVVVLLLQRVPLTAIRSSTRRSGVLLHHGGS